jgi:hypothetical protein
MIQEREKFGRGLREEREARSLTVAEVARVTKIPERSIEWIEAGSFDRLPAEVFVRGFLKSYCRVVGLDAEATLRRFGELVHDGKKREPAPTLTRPAPLGGPRSGSAGRGGPERDGGSQPTIEGENPRAVAEESSVISRTISEARRRSRRVPLTLAVIILVIVATLTLSLLLRRPSHVGDGLSLTDQAAGSRG